MQKAGVPPPASADLMKATTEVGSFSTLPEWLLTRSQTQRRRSACFTPKIGFDTHSRHKIGYHARLWVESQILHYVTTPTASKLTGLSTEKLREWTSRRALVPADVRPKQQGSPAKFSWQTILVLRIAVALRDRFHLELQAHRDLFAGLRNELRSRSFVALWGQSLALGGDGAWTFIDDAGPIPNDDTLLIRLDSHLRVLSVGFALPDPATAPGQLDLFSLPNMHGIMERGCRRPRPSASTVAVRRRSA